MPENLPATQVRYPWRAAARTAAQAAVAVVVAIPLIAAELPPAAWVTELVTVSAVMSRVMAIPAVNDLLALAGLGAEGKKL